MPPLERVVKEISETIEYLRRPKISKGNLRVLSNKEKEIEDALRRERAQALKEEQYRITRAIEKKAKAKAKPTAKPKATNNVTATCTYCNVFWPLFR